MKKVFFLGALVLMSVTPSYADQSKCINDAINAVFNSQVEANNLSPADKAKFAVEFYGQMIDKDPQYLETVKQLEVFCTRSYVMAVPLPKMDNGTTSK